MSWPRGVRDTLLFVGLLVMVLTPDAHAYIDPGTGSFIFQAVIATLIGSAFAIKIFWRNISSFLLNLVKGKKGEDEGS